MDKIFVLTCQNEDGDICSIVASKSLDTLVNTMEREWNSMVKSFICEGYEGSDKASYISKAWHSAVAANMVGEDAMYYSWEIKEIDVI